MADYSGVYVIENTINGKQYVGSAVNLRERRNNHFNTLKKGKHRNGHLQRAFNLYGEDAFVFKHVLICEKFELLRYEQSLIDALKPEYNIHLIAGSPLGIKRSLEAREKVRQAKLGKERSPETKEKMRQANLGKKLSPEHKEKIRQANLGKKYSLETKEKVRQANLGKKYSLETKEKMRQAKLGKKYSPETKEKKRQAMLGRKHSPETREKMSQSALIRGKILHLQDEKE